jgi:hypothetical protein
MDEKIVKDIMKGLNDAAEGIKKASNCIADLTFEADGFKDKLGEAEADAFVSVSTKTNDEGKLKYSSDKVREMATIRELSIYNTSFTKNRSEYRERIASIEKKKAEIIRLHEQRRDLMANIELLKLLGAMQI